MSRQGKTGAAGGLVLSPEARRQFAAARRRQERRWSRRSPARDELTASPEADEQAAVQRELARREVERARQAAQPPPGPVHHVAITLTDGTRAELDLDERVRGQ